MTKLSNNKANGTKSPITLRQFYDEFIPYIEVVSEIKADTKNINKKLTAYCTNNDTAHNRIAARLDGKISAKAFGAWLGSLFTLFTILAILVGFSR